MRMDRYEEKKEEVKEEKVLSRLDKNKDMYNEVYLNSSYVDLNNILNVDEANDVEVQEENPTTKIEYQEKSYNVNDYLEKARENYHPDNDKRSLTDKEFLDTEDEISKLIEKINEKEEDSEFFSDLISDNENTMIEGQIASEEITEVTHKKLFSTEFFDDEAKLEKALGSETITDLKLEQEGISNTFQDIVLNNRFSNKKKKKIAIIFFSITLFFLILVILIIIFK